MGIRGLVRGHLLSRCAVQLICRLLTGAFSSRVSHFHEPTGRLAALPLRRRGLLKSVHLGRRQYVF